MQTPRGVPPTDQRAPIPFGRALHDARTSRGWTLRELARATGLSHSFLSQVERGLDYASLDTILRICELLEITPERVAEVRLAQARREFDERVNLGRALSNLELFEAAAQARARERAATLAARQERNHQRRRGDRRSAGSPPVDEPPGSA